MVFKEEAVLERLKRLEEVIARLQRYRGQSREDFLRDTERQWLVERGFILAAECVADICGHILSGRFRVHPADHEDAIRLLGVEGVLSSALMARLQGFGGFRNILVHDYLRVDPSRVHEYLETGLDSLSDFVAEIMRWLGR
ncbi:MAG: DUF86 domain-containing protein [Planctomycetota bacterium]